MLYAFLLALLSPTPAAAFRFEPMVLSLPLTQPQASGTYTVENNSQQKIAVEVQVKKRVIDENGQEARPNAAGFLVYPEQLALAPGEKRSVRVTWTGESLPPPEEAYRVVAAQLPVEFAPDTSGRAQLKFLVEYVASLYLEPPKMKPRVKVVKHLVKKGQLEILVENSGNAHFLLDQMQITYKSGKQEGHPDPAVLRELRTENLLPGNRRWLRMPLPKGFGEPLKVSVVFEP